MEEDREYEKKGRKEGGKGVKVSRNERKKKRSKQTESIGRKEMF